MAPTTNKKTQRVLRGIPREGIARSPFAGGNKELLANPAYQIFREVMSRDPRGAANMMGQDPSCVIFAAEMLSDPDKVIAIEAGATLICAIELGIDVAKATAHLKRTLIYESDDQLRLSAAKAFHAMALRGCDLSTVFMALEGAYSNDKYENVRLTAEMALITAGRPPKPE